MKRKILLLLICLTAIPAIAQDQRLRMTYRLNVLAPDEMNLSDIKDISFVETEPLELVGEWFNVDDAAFESFTFSEGGLLDYYYFIKAANDGGSAKGNYQFVYDVLGLRVPTVFSSIQYHPIVSHSETSFTLRSGGRNYIYYKILHSYDMSTYGSPIVIGNEDDEVSYVDNTVIGLVNGKITALRQGQGYALLKDKQRNTTVAYRVNVKYQPDSNGPIDWTNYFKKSKEEIIAEFGTPDKTETSMGYETLSYSKGYNPEIKLLSFRFEEGVDAARQVSAMFYGQDEFETYKKVIESKYIKQKVDTYETYYGDTADESTSNVMICSSETNDVKLIIYTDRQ